MQENCVKENIVNHLLHLDSSIRPESVSRRVSGVFADVWREQNPQGTYTYRDLGAEPVPHLDAAQVDVMTRLESAGVRDLTAARVAATDSERASWALTWSLVDELLAADTVVIGLPMHNFTVPSVFKAWFDRVVIPPLVVDPATGTGPLHGRRVVVVTARGGAYGPGTPRAGFDFQEPYLRSAFSMLGLDGDLLFIHAELTKSAHVPRLAGFKQAAAESLGAALEAAAEAARTATRGGSTLVTT